MPYVDSAGLSRFDSRQKDRIGREYALLRDMQWLRTEKAGAVTCWPVGGTPLKPAVDFLFAETPPAEGDKGPENPSTISGVSSVKVTRCGRNLALNRSTATSNGVTCTANGDGTYTVNGQATGGMAQFPLITAYSKLPIATGGWATISGCPSGGSTSTYSTYLELRDKNAVWKASRYDTGGVPFPFEATEDGYLTYSILLKEGTSVSNLLFKPQMEFGTAATEFEKPEYNEYIIPLGSTYYGGTVDLATGVMTVTVGATVLDENYNFGTTSGFLTEYTDFYAIVFYPGFGPYATGGNIPPTFASNRLPIEYKSGSASPTQNSLLLGSNSRGMKLCLSKSDLSLGDGATITAVRTAMLQWLSIHPVMLTCPLETPTTVQLTPTEILALTQTDKYTPRLNTIYTDASAVQVGYVKSPIREEFELQQAVAAQGGGV